jgi:hypothetical protein
VFITTVFHRALASCCSRKIEYDVLVFMVQEYYLLEGKFREEAS